MSKLDKSFWEGFDVAMDMVFAYIQNSDLFQHDEGKLIGNEMIDELAEEIEMYKKDG